MEHSRNVPYWILFGVMFGLALISLPMVCALVFFKWGETALLATLGAFVLIVTLGGVGAYRRRDVSALGKLLRGEPIAG